jgi:putative transposase
MFRKQKHAEYCKDALHIAAREYSISIKELAVMPDHIHMIAGVPADMSQSRAMQLLKGRSSYELFRAVPAFRLRYPRGSLWSRGNFKDSLGRITVEAAEKYVREQQSSLESFTRNCGL